MKCQGCDNPASAFQCPLCQAEAITDSGFFCSQECFAKNWLEHRNTAHKSGVVKEKKVKKVEKPIEEDKKSKKKKRAREEEGDTPSVDITYFPPWRPFPPEAECTKQKWATVHPPLAADCRKAIVRTDGGDEWDALWPAAVAAAQYVARTAVSPQRTVIVAGSAATAHAFSWAARCAGLGGQMRMVVAVTDSEEEPSTWFTEQRRVMVVTEEVMSYYGNSVGRWLPQAGGLLVTLPDVANAVDLQGVHTRAVFFVSKTTTDDLSDWSKEETATHTLSLLPPAALYGDQPLLHPLLTSSEGSVLRYRPVGDLPAPPRLDNDIATSIANGDCDAMIQHVARLFSHHEGLTEEVLRFSLSYDWGAVDVCHWHHRLARTTRRLVDQSNQFSAKKGATLADIVLRVAAFLVRLAPPLTVETTESRAKKTAKLSEGDKNEGVTVNELEKYRNYYSTAPDLQLQATLCHLFDRCPPNIIDTLGVAWGLSWVLPGMKATFTKLNKTRHEMVARIRLRYGSKIDPHTGEFLVILAHLLYDTVGEYSLPIERLEERLAWRYTLAVELGDLRSFLTNCFLLSGSNNRQERKDARKAREAVEEEEDPSMVVKPLSSRQTGKVLPRHVVLYQQHEVKVPAPAVFYPLDWKPLPLTEQRSLHVQKMRSIALSEILMAMPPKQKPMHVGSVGNLIGKWSAFNARFDGCLGISLSEFLLQHPEDFLVSGTLVTRRKAGKTEQVRMRFDQDQEDGSDDDEGRKTRDRKSLTGLSNKEKIELPRRAQKKRAIKEFNRSRFNRNHKKSDPSARVPGYVKHGPRRIKGRGKKANIRNYKRGA